MQLAAKEISLKGQDLSKKMPQKPFKTMLVRIKFWKANRKTVNL